MSDLIEAMARDISEAGGANDWKHAMAVATAALAALRETHHLVPRATGDDGELVEMLEATALDCERRFNWLGAAKDIRQAAARITALSAEVERITKAYDELRRYIYDKTPERREYVIQKHQAALGAKP